LLTERGEVGLLVASVVSGLDGGVHLVIVRHPRVRLLLPLPHAGRADHLSNGVGSRAIGGRPLLGYCVVSCG